MYCVILFTGIKDKAKKVKRRKVAFLMIVSLVIAIKSVLDFYLNKLLSWYLLVHCGDTGLIKIKVQKE